MDTLNDRLTRAAVLYVTPDRTPTIRATSSDGDWPDTTRLEVLTDPVLSIAPSSLAGDLALWTLTDEQATAVRAAQSVRVTVDASLPVIAATVVDTTGWRGLPGADDEPWSVVVGPQGDSLVMIPDGSGGVEVTSCRSTNLTADGSGGVVLTIA